MAIHGGKEVSRFIRDVLKILSTIPKQIEKMKKSAARAGAMTYVPDVDALEIIGGFPEFKDDGTPFSAAYYARYAKETRVLASQLVEGLDLKKYQTTYDESNMRVQPPSFEPFDLNPQHHKHTFAPDVDPTPIMHDDAIFQALTSIDWNLDNLQIKGVEELARDDPEA